MKSTWKKYLLYAAYTLLASGLLYGLLQLILSGYAVTWTGFQTKTLWDWLDLLIIPIVLALGAFFLNRSERIVERETENKRAKLEHEIAKDRQQEAAFQSYIDRMSELLLEKKLLTTNAQEVRDIARTLTLSVMRGLDKGRNKLIIQFLREAGLTTNKHSIFKDARIEDMDLTFLPLRGFNLQNTVLLGSKLNNADLFNSNMQNVNLSGINMKYANLESADLRRALLIDTDLQFAYLIETNLFSAYLSRANLQMANLTSANLERADLAGANLKDAKVTPEQLAQAKSLKGTIMPDGTVHE